MYSNGVREERKKLIKGGVGSILVAAGRPIIELLLALLLVRILGGAGYGQFSYAIVVITFLAIPVQSGLPTLVVRYTASYAAQTRWGYINGLWIAANIIALSYCVVVGGAVLGFIWLLTLFLEAPPDSTLLWVLALMPALVLISVTGAKLRGLGKPVQGQLGEQIARPILFAILVTMFWQIPVARSITPAGAIGINIVAALLALSLTHFLVLRTWSARKIRFKIPLFAWRIWLQAIVPLAFIGGVQIINRQTDILVVGLMESDQSVGIYRVTAQLATLGLLLLQAIGYTLSPHFARLFVGGDMDRLQRYAKRSAQFTLIGALSIFAIYLAYGNAILVNAFGLDFEIGRNVLLILAFGHVISGFFGPVGFLLTMTGYEREVLYVLGVSAMLNVVLNLLLVPLIGIEGAALATVISTLVWNVGFWWVARQKLLIRSSAVGL